MRRTLLRLLAKDALCRQDSRRLDLIALTTRTQALVVRAPTGLRVASPDGQVIRFRDELVRGGRTCLDSPKRE